MDAKEFWEMISFGCLIFLGLSGLGVFGFLIIAAIKGTVISFAGAGFLGAVMLPAAEICIVGTTIVGGIAALKAVTEKAKKDPYSWLLPVLAILSGFIVDTFKDLISDPSKETAGFVEAIEKNLYGGIAAVIFVGAGILWRLNASRFRIAMKIFAIVLFAFPLIWLYFDFGRHHPRRDFFTFLIGEMNLEFILLLLLFIGLCAGTMLLNKANEQKSR